MVNYIFLIGSLDHYSSIEELKSSYLASPKAFLGHFYGFTLPEGIGDVVPLMVGRGFACTNDWSLNDSVSCLIRSN